MFAFHTPEWEQTLSKNITSLVPLHISWKSEHCVKAARKGAYGCHPFDSWMKQRDHLQWGLNGGGFCELCKITLGSSKKFLDSIVTPFIEIYLLFSGLA